MKQSPEISILPVPFDYGAGRGGAAGGPDAILQAGLESKLQALNLPYMLHPASYLPGVQFDFRTLPEMKNWGRVLTLSTSLAEAVAELDANGDFPLLLGGDHSMAIGSIAGLTKKRKRLGVLWIDAHSDLNTPSTTPSGNIHGMSLAAGLGLGDARFCNILGNNPKLHPERIVLIGARDLDNGERRLIKERNIACFTMHDIDRLGMASVMEQAIKIAASGSDGVHLSFDIDSVDREKPQAQVPLFEAG